MREDKIAILNVSLNSRYFLIKSKCPLTIKRGEREESVIRSSNLYVDRIHVIRATVENLWLPLCVFVEPLRRPGVLDL